jgi:hypothetical protein
MPESAPMQNCPSGCSSCRRQQAIGQQTALRRLLEVVHELPILLGQLGVVRQGRCFGRDGGRVGIHGVPPRRRIDRHRSGYPPSPAQTSPVPPVSRSGSFWHASPLPSASLTAAVLAGSPCLFHKRYCALKLRLSDSAARGLPPPLPLPTGRFPTSSGGPRSKTRSRTCI